LVVCVVRRIIIIVVAVSVVVIDMVEVLVLLSIFTFVLDSTPIHHLICMNMMMIVMRIRIVILLVSFSFSMMGSKIGGWLYITTDHDEHIHILESIIRTCIIYMDGMIPRKDDKMWC
jgi:hypothetical protein